MPTKRSARPTTLSCGPVQHVDSVFGSSPAPPVSHINVGLVRKCSDALRARAGRCRTPLSSIEVRDVRKNGPHAPRRRRAVACSTRTTRPAPRQLFLRPTSTACSSDARRGPALVAALAAHRRRCRSKRETREKRSARPVTTSRGRVQYPNYTSGTSAAVPLPHVDGMLVRKSSDARRGLASTATAGSHCMQTSSITSASATLSAGG